MTSPLTFVTVVFDAEVPLLELQARSLRRHLDPDAVAAIIVLDNCVRGLGAHAEHRLESAYGPLWNRVLFIRTRELIGQTAAIGWRSQQAAKLAVALRVDTPHYVVLDAKNHLTRHVGIDAFVGADGRAHGGLHEYHTHPLRASLEHTLRYLGASTEVINGAMSEFPPTATPFVFDTAIVRQMITDIASTSGASFSEEFERQKLLEFFLYSGWLRTKGPGIDAAIDGRSIASPTVWPKAASVEGVQAAIDEARRDDAFVFAVHRQVLARADRATREAIADHWHELGLFGDVPAAHSFIRRFRRRYLPAIVWTRAVERLRRLA